MCLLGDLVFMATSCNSAKCRSVSLGCAVMFFPTGIMMVQPGLRVYFKLYPSGRDHDASDRNCRCAMQVKNKALKDAIKRAGDALQAIQKANKMIVGAAAKVTKATAEQTSLLTCGCHYSASVTRVYPPYSLYHVVAAGTCHCQYQTRRNSSLKPA